MGRKSIFADDPADKADTDIVETQIKLNDAADVLPIGLRVTVQFLSADPHAATVH
jgi:hypothetical protein